MPELDYSSFDSAGYSSGPESAAGAAFLGVFYLSLYIYMALALTAIAKKTGTKNAWFAWVPILDIFLVLKIAGKSYWWFLLLFIPIVNIVFGIIIWMKIAEKVGKPNWWGILLLIPGINLIVPGYLAWSKSSISSTTPPTSTA